MALNNVSRQARETGETVQDTYNHVADANLVMTVRDTIVIVSLTAANNSAITLPSVSEAKGGIFTIRLAAVGSGTVTISDKSNDAGLTDISLTAAGQYVNLFSDGLVWMSSLFSGATSSSSLTVSGATALNGGLTMDTNKFTVADTSGDTAIAGTLTVTGATTLNGGLSMDSGAFAVANTTGAISGGASADIAINTNKFTVAASSGNTLVAGTLDVTGNLTPAASVIRTGQQYVVSTAGARAGATGGWVVTGANVGQATLPQNQTASTMVVPVNLPLKVGATITAYSIIAQVESAGGTVTIDCALHKVTNAAGDPTDSDIGSITQVSVTADTALAASKTLAAPEVIAADETFYFLVTATTGATTDIQFQGFTITISEV